MSKKYETLTKYIEFFKDDPIRISQEIYYNTMNSFLDDFYKIVEFDEYEISPVQSVDFLPPELLSEVIDEDGCLDILLYFLSNVRFNEGVLLNPLTQEYILLSLLKLKDLDAKK